MNKWLNKPLFSQRYLQTFFIFFSHALLASSPMFSKRTKRKIKHICVQATLIFSIDLWPKHFCNKKKKAQFVIFSAEQEFTNSCIEKSTSKVVSWTQKGSLIAIMLSAHRRGSRKERNGFVKAKAKQVIVYKYLQDFFSLKPFRDYCLCSVYIFSRRS